MASTTDAVKTAVPFSPKPVARTDVQVERDIALAKAAAGGAVVGGTPAAVATGTGSPLLDAITDAIVSAHPELKAVQDLIRAGQDAAALEALYKTDYYSKFQGQVLANDTLKLTKKQAYEDTITNEWLPTLRRYATQEGLDVSDANLATIAKAAFDMGLTPTAAGTLALFQNKDPKTGKAYVTGITGGLASTTRSNLASLNSDYGAGFNQSWIDTASQSVALGTTTEQFWTDQIKNQAAGAFPAWADQIKAGLTMKQIASPYINAYSNILGIDPAQITLNDNLLKQGLQGTDPTKPSGMPLWEFEKAVRKDPRWADSKDAMDSLSNTGATLLRQWGLMS